MSKILKDPEWEFRRGMIDVLNRLVRMSLEFRLDGIDGLAELAEREAESLQMRFLRHCELPFEEAICYEAEPQIIDVSPVSKPSQWMKGHWTYAKALDRVFHWPDNKSCMFRQDRPEMRLEKRNGEMICIETQADGSELITPAITVLTDSDRKAEDWIFCFDAD